MEDGHYAHLWQGQQSSEFLRQACTA